MVILKNVDKVYYTGDITVNALKNISLTIEDGELIAITGPSGSGKSTLMNLIGLLDRPSSGSLSLAGQEVTLNMSDKRLARMRSHNIGFVFQSFHLLPRLSALDNVLLPTIYSNKPDSTARAESLLERVGLEDRMSHRPNELSGGEKQRVAIARALINDPEIILADEPTGNLDSKSGEAILRILHELHENGKTIIVVTHDNAIAKQTQRNIRLFDGEILEEETFWEKLKERFNIT